MKENQQERHLMTLYIPRLIPSDADSSFAQGAIGDAEVSDGNVETRRHVATENFIIANVGAVPIDFSNLLVGCLEAHFEGALSARGRIFSTTMAPFDIGSSYNRYPLGARGFVEWVA